MKENQKPLEKKGQSLEVDKNSKNTNQKRKKDELDSLELWSSFHQEISVRDWKGMHRVGKKNVKHISKNSY